MKNLNKHLFREGKIHSLCVRIIFVCLALMGATTGNICAVKLLKVRWLDKECDFGVIKEAAGKATRYVRFVNEDTEPIVVSDVIPSCGCTVAEFPEDPVAPGDTARIAVVYDPVMRPGRIAKSMRVILGEYDSATIYLTGTVIGTPATLDTLYPVNEGPVRLSNGILSFGKMTRGTTRHSFLNIYNQTTDSIGLSAVLGNKALSLDLSTSRLGPGDLGTLSVYFNSRDTEDMGALSIPLEIITDGPEGTHSVVVKAEAIVEPDFSNLTDEERRNAPNIMTDPDRVDLGTVEGKEIKFSFRIGNEGKSILRIPRIYSIGNIIEINKYPHEVKPGKEGKAEGIFRASEIEPGPFNRIITLVTNDPLNPMKEVNVVGIKQ